MEHTTEQTWDLLLEYGVLTEDELQLVTSMNGYSERTLLDALYCRTGLRTIEQLESEGY